MRRKVYPTKRPFPSEKNPRLLSFDDLRNKKGIAFSRAHIYRMIGVGKFPKPVHIGEARIAWVDEEIEAWIEGRIAERDAAVA